MQRPVASPQRDIWTWNGLELADIYIYPLIFDGEVLVEEQMVRLRLLCRLTTAASASQFRLRRRSSVHGHPSTGRLARWTSRCLRYSEMRLRKAMNMLVLDLFRNAIARWVAAYPRELKILVPVVDNELPGRRGGLHRDYRLGEFRSLLDSLEGGLDSTSCNLLTDEWYL